MANATAFEHEQLFGTGHRYLASAGFEFPEQSAWVLNAVKAPAVAESTYFFVQPRPIAAISAAAALGRVNAYMAWNAQVVSAAADLALKVQQQRLRARASALADVLEHEMVARSSMARVHDQPAFARLLASRDLGISTALERLEGRQRPLWLYFLRQAESDRPAEDATGVADAAAHWRRWGQARGFTR